jgi:hypothetical protein
MRTALIAVALIAAALALPRGRLVARPVLRYGRGGRFETREGALFCHLMETE